jgi:hypothetical protein
VLGCSIFLLVIGHQKVKLKNCDDKEALRGKANIFMCFRCPSFQSMTPCILEQIIFWAGRLDPVVYANKKKVSCSDAIVSNM